MTFRISKRAVALAAAVAFAAFGAVAGADAADKTPIKFVGVPLAEFAPIWAAKDLGYFDEVNLDVTINPTAAASSAEAAALLVSGEYQLAMGSVATIAQAVSQGLELVVVSGATVVGGPEDESQQVLSRKDGPASLKDLAAAGNTIAVSAINSPTMVYTMNAIELAGGDPKAPKYQAAASPTIEELIMNKSVQAGVLLNPFLSAAKANPDIQVIGSVSAAMPANTPAISVISSKAFVSANPEVMNGVRAAIAKGVAWASAAENREAVNDLIVKYTGRDRKVIAGAKLPQYSTTLTAANIETLLGMFARYGALENAPAVDAIVDAAALSK